MGGVNGLHCLLSMHGRPYGMDEHAMENPTGMENPTPDVRAVEPTPDELTEGAADVTPANDEAAAGAT